MNGDFAPVLSLRHVVNRCRRILSRMVDPIARLQNRSASSIDWSLELPTLLDTPLIAWLNYHQREILGKKCFWLWHRALKNPLDAWIYQEIIWETKPDVIVEIGNKNGGSTLFLASILELIGQGKVLAVDINHSRYTAVHPRIELLTGDCGDDRTLSAVKECCAGKQVLIIHDAEHTYSAVLRNLRNYTPLVSLDSYISIHQPIIWNIRYSP